MGAPRSIFDDLVDDDQAVAVAELQAGCWQPHAEHLENLAAAASSRSVACLLRPSLFSYSGFLNSLRRRPERRGEERAAKKEKRKKAKDERGRKGRRKGRVLIKRGRGRRGQRESGERGGRHRVASVSATETLSPAVPSLFLQMSD